MAVGSVSFVPGDLVVPLHDAHTNDRFGIPKGTSVGIVIASEKTNELLWIMLGDELLNVQLTTWWKHV